MNTHVPERLWMEELQAFTLRNAGRQAVIEEDGPDFGAQLAVEGLELRGVAFDPRDRNVAIMLGELSGTDNHLDHSIRNIESIDLLRSDEGYDIALRIAHDAGQTLVRFMPP